MAGTEVRLIRCTGTMTERYLIDEVRSVYRFIGTGMWWTVSYGGDTSGVLFHGYLDTWLMEGGSGQHFRLEGSNTNTETWKGIFHELKCHGKMYNWESVGPVGGKAWTMIGEVDSIDERSHGTFPERRE